MGLLEKAGQIQTDGAKPAPKKKAAKAAKPKKAKKKEAVSIEDELDDLDLGGSDGGSRALPDEFVRAGKPAQFARALIDLLVTYGWMIPLIAMTAYGSVIGTAPKSYSMTRRSAPNSFNVFSC